MKLSDLSFGELIRDAEFNWLGLTAEEYFQKKHLTFLTSDKYIDELNNNKSVSAVITTKELVPCISKNVGILVVQNPKTDFFELHNKLAETNFYNKNIVANKISKKANIADTVKIRGKNIVIEDDVIIDDYVVIYSNVTIRKGTRIGAGTIVGSRPLEVLTLSDKNIPIIPIGEIFIDEFVNIQSNSTVEMGVFGQTYIGKYVQIDDLVQIGHDVKIQDQAIIVAGSVIGGRTRIGKKSYISINATLRNGIEIGEESRVSMGAVVSRSVESGKTVTGNLAIEHSKFMENLKKI
ncbi:MAG: UDP-3-O-(3-hydroxymyristoyl)glucosamine N-acyltransferase [Fusobacterium sp.]|uniref:UDP-3-O-(3-hydroxymyristoyl)glucosamine N-acyltransferase n=1 Tax=Fusobacterium sp. TaxID=68766 RepID=UPI0026DD34AD|nr:UDP-3-O-(3-hydroxymyristoyl)glucosamine N-acyltransferase [Fusobacterium sp.]MDO4690249.1 UDP-3-O-(3-hydroxymyristoyl)glucosamine N-acyltransferase [Fusobacterium sp.]